MYPQIRNSICDQQHCSTKKRSPVTQLLPYLDDLYNQKILMLLVFCFDFRNAFNPVPYHILLKKLAKFGLDEDLSRFFNSYPYSRSQRVSINGFLSQTPDINSGVPQASVLGPLLFIIFINDLPHKVENSPAIYLQPTVIADDKA